MNQTEQVAHTTPVRAIFSLRWQVAAQDKRITELEQRIEQLETCATLNAETIGHVAELRRITAVQDECIEELGQRFAALEGSLRQGTGELKAIINDICDRLEGLEATIDRNAKLLAQGITGNTISVERLRATLRDVTRCLIDGRVDRAMQTAGELHRHRILGTESVQAMVEVYHRLEK